MAHADEVHSSLYVFVMAEKLSRTVPSHLLLTSYSPHLNMETAQTCNMFSQKYSILVLKLALFYIHVFYTHDLYTCIYIFCRITLCFENLTEP